MKKMNGKGDAYLEDAGEEGVKKVKKERGNLRRAGREVMRRIFQERKGTRTKRV
jgi:hypothetical protein